MKSFVAKDINWSLSDWQIKIRDMKVEPDKLWLVTRYVLLSLVASSSSGGSRDTTPSAREQSTLAAL